MIIMGIDPGFAITGYGVVKYEGNKFSVVDYGAITTVATMKLSQRLLVLYNDLEKLIEKHKPEALSIEELFFNKNAKSVMKVGQARGVEVLAAKNMGLDIFEYTPLQIKQAVYILFGELNSYQWYHPIKYL